MRIESPFDERIADVGQISITEKIEYFLVVPNFASFVARFVQKFQILVKKNDHVPLDIVPENRRCFLARSAVKLISWA